MKGRIGRTAKGIAAVGIALALWAAPAQAMTQTTHSGSTTDPYVEQVYQGGLVACGYDGIVVRTEWDQAPMLRVAAAQAYGSIKLTDYLWHWQWIAAKSSYGWVMRDSASISADLGIFGETYFDSYLTADLTTFSAPITGYWTVTFKMQTINSSGAVTGWSKYTLPVSSDYVAAPSSGASVWSTTSSAGCYFSN